MIETPTGQFSTEASTSVRVEDEAREAIVNVLGWTHFEMRLLDDLGGPWSPAAADEQAARLLALSGPP